MSEAGRHAAAKVLAATMTLMAREMEGLSPPLSLWMPPIKAGDIKGAAQEVISGEAVPLWVDDSHPAMGLAICRSRPLETALL
ncbi:MAG: hypothetical protein LBU69_03965, partial [Deltaproteobacteria bacterium]|nr:hypothetical protein [Deltaproteobacteria bacterium]